MFYGLSQAGRALCAASPRLTGNLEWQLQAHGISNPGFSADLPDIKVAIKGEDKPGRKSLSFAGVSKALGSPLWQANDAPTLRQLWDAIPEMSGHWFSGPPTQRPALAAEPVVASELAGHPLVTAQVDVPDWLSLKPADFPDFMKDYASAAAE